MANESQILYTNVAADATMTVTNEETGYEKEYLVDSLVSVPYRSTGITEIKITFDFGAAKTVQGVTVHKHNVESGDTTYKWESSNNNFTDTIETQNLTLLTRTVKELNANNVLTDVTRRDAYYFDEWDERYYRVRIQKASGSYIEMGEICIWTGNYTCDKNFSIGYSMGKETIFSNVNGSNGQVFRRFKNSRVIGDFPFENLDDTQKELFDETIGLNEHICFFDHMRTQLFFGGLKFGIPVNIRTTDSGTPAETWNMQGAFTEHIG